MIRRSMILALTAGALAVPGVASASTLTSDAACYGTDQRVKLSGTGFTPEYAVSLTGDAGGNSVYPDSNGSFTDGDVGLAANNTFTPRSFTIRAHDQVDATHDTSITVMNVRSGSNLPVRGKSSATVMWSFGGFPTGATIYGHYRYARNSSFRTVRDVKFGTATGPCGVLNKKAKRIPVRAKRGGSWYLQVDTKPKFSSSTEPEYDVTFTAR